MDRGTLCITVPDKAHDYVSSTVTEEVNAEDMGVNFAAWLARDPKQKLSDPTAQRDYCLDLWWSRNFYPDLQMVANDLYTKGLIGEGKHTILVDW
jgi:hypothetical protein